MGYMSEFGYDAETGKLFVPEVIIPTYLGRLSCTWLNTRMRFFMDEQYDHIEHTRDDDESGEVLGIIVDQEVMDVLYENDFPYSWDPIPDPTTNEWLVKILSRDLNSSDEAFNEGQDS